MHRIPETGRPWDALKEELEAAKSGDYAWRRGRMAVYVFHRDEALERVQKGAYLAYFTENNLGQRAFPSLKRLEEEVVGMGLSLLHAPPGAGGTFTSGGSESIFLSMLAAREQGRERGIAAGGNIVLPDTAHLTFDRAAWYLGLEARRVPAGPDLRADVAAMERAVDAGTVAIVGSAPCYPFGVFDPIEALGQVALRRTGGLWLHVDACVGGFLSPFAARLGHPIPGWDFRVPGVTAVSADIHKHGMAAKGASLLLLRDDALRRLHRFESRAWQRGPYVAYTSQGTRPGGAVAAAWAVMRYLGEDGYLDCARRIMGAKRAMTEGIAAIPGLQVLLPSDLSIFVYRAADPAALDIGKVAAAMDRRGWLPGRQQEPDGMHLHLNPIHAGIVEEYLRDLREAVAEAREGRVEAMAAGRAY